MKSVEVNQKIRGGVPVLTGTRLPVSRILAEIADSDFIIHFAESYHIDSTNVRHFLSELAAQFDQPSVTEETMNLYQVQYQFPNSPIRERLVEAERYGIECGRLVFFKKDRLIATFAKGMWLTVGRISSDSVPTTARNPESVDDPDESVDELYAKYKAACQRTGKTALQDRGDFSDIWQMVKDLVSANARHRSGFNLRDIDDDTILAHASDELHELRVAWQLYDQGIKEHDSDVVDELGDLIGILVHFAITRGLDAHALSRVIRRKFDERFTKGETQCDQ